MLSTFPPALWASEIRVTALEIIMLFVSFANIANAFSIGIPRFIWLPSF